MNLYIPRNKIWIIDWYSVTIVHGQEKKPMGGWVRKRLGRQKEHFGSGKRRDLRASAECVERRTTINSTKNQSKTQKSRWKEFWAKAHRGSKDRGQVGWGTSNKNEQEPGIPSLIISDAVPRNHREKKKDVQKPMWVRRKKNLLLLKRDWHLLLAGWNAFKY